MTDAFGPALDHKVAARLNRLTELVLAANDRVRLTAITDRDEFLVKHLFDSLAPLELGCAPLPGQLVADLGSGGGFPGMVLAIAVQEASFTLIEATHKKADFLREAVSALGLANVAVWPRRAEEAGAAEGREAFSLVTARAVAALPILVELAHPLLVVGGELLAWKGPEGEEEIAAADAACRRLGAEIRAVRPYALPHGMGRRLLVVVVKTGPTPPGFPRRPGMAEKKPLSAPG